MKPLNEIVSNEEHIKALFHERYPASEFLFDTFRVSNSSRGVNIFGRARDKRHRSVNMYVNFKSLITLSSEEKILLAKLGYDVLPSAEIVSDERILAAIEMPDNPMRYGGEMTQVTVTPFDYGSGLSFKAEIPPVDKFYEELENTGLDKIYKRLTKKQREAIKTGMSESVEFPIDLVRSLTPEQMKMLDLIETGVIPEQSVKFNAAKQHLYHDFFSGNTKPFEKTPGGTISLGGADGPKLRSSPVSAITQEIAQTDFLEEPTGNRIFWEFGESRSGRMYGSQPQMQQMPEAVQAFLKAAGKIGTEHIHDERLAGFSPDFLAPYTPQHDEIIDGKDIYAQAAATMFATHNELGGNPKLEEVPMSECPVKKPLTRLVTEPVSCQAILDFFYPDYDMKLLKATTGEKEEFIYIKGITGKNTFIGGYANKTKLGVRIHVSGKFYFKQGYNPFKLVKLMNSLGYDI